MSSVTVDRPSPKVVPADLPAELRVAIDPPPALRAARRTDLDALRLLICAAVIVAHAALIFAEEPRYHLKSAVPSLSATVFYEFMRISTMAVFFVIAGWSAVVSLRRRSAGYFAMERIARILVPLAFGTLVFGAAIKYIELRHGRHLGLHGVVPHTPIDMHFFEFAYLYVKRSSLVTWSHLWFLGYLLVISLLLLPLLLWLARGKPRSELPGIPIVYVPAAALAALLAGFEGYWPFLPSLINDWTNFAYFALCFAIGAGMAAWPGFETRLQAEAPRMLVLMLVAFAGVLWFGESTVGRILVGITAWGAIGAGLGYAARINPPPTPTFLYLSEATMPVYVVHHLPLLLVAAAVLPLDLPVWIKIMAITLSAALIAFAAYHWLIKPWPPMRWLMGMSAKKPRDQAKG